MQKKSMRGDNLNIMEGIFTLTGMKFFSVYGLIALILAFIPNIVFAKKTHQAKLDDLDTCGFAVCMLEMIFHLIMAGALLLIRMPLTHYAFAMAAGVMLLLYYIAWIRYYKGGAYYPEIYTESFFGIPLPMATFSVMYYLFVSVWLGNLIALCAALIYGVCHIANAAAAKKDIKCRL